VRVGPSTLRGRRSGVEPTRSVARRCAAAVTVLVRRCQRTATAAAGRRRVGATFLAIRRFVADRLLRIRVRSRARDAARNGRNRRLLHEAGRRTTARLLTGYRRGRRGVRRRRRVSVGVCLEEHVQRKLDKLRERSVKQNRSFDGDNRLGH